MKFFLKIFFIILILAGLFVIGFEIWGGHFEQIFSQQACGVWFDQMKPWAWAVAIGLLLSDLLLPIPATGVMAALGSVYGVWLGTLVAAVGSTAAGILGYGLARLAGKSAARFLASEVELIRFQALFESWGGAAIIVSRWLPILPEVMSILAGLAKMSFHRFLTALLLGTLPVCFLYAYLGHISREMPGYGMAIAIVAPLVLWPVFLKFIPSRHQGATPVPDP